MGYRGIGVSLDVEQSEQTFARDFDHRYIGQGLHGHRAWRTVENSHEGKNASRSRGRKRTLLSRDHLRDLYLPGCHDKAEVGHLTFLAKRRQGRHGSHPAGLKENRRLQG
jgi:hypothetical protein